jgi:hypothetical protein
MIDRLDRELSLRAIVGFAVGLVVITAVSAVGLWYFSKLLRGQLVANDPPTSALAAAAGSYEPPAPRLQTDPVREMAALRAAEEELLGTYGLVDREAGIARIPIDRSIALLVGDDGGSEAPAPRPAEEGH